MAVSLGDITLYFRAETSDLHGAVREIGDRLPSELGRSQKTIDELNRSLDATGDNMAYAGEEGAKAAQHIGTEFHRAQGEVALIGELFGIRLPRHVRSFIAALPGVGEALSAAFSATAVIFIGIAIYKAIEAVQKFQERATELAQGWVDIGEKSKASLASMDDQILETQITLEKFNKDHVKVLRDELILIDRQTLNQLRKEFDDTAKSIDDLMKKSVGWQEWLTYFTQLYMGMNDQSPRVLTKIREEFEGFTKQYHELLEAGKKSEAWDVLVNKIDELITKLPTLSGAQKALTQDLLDSLQKFNEEQNKAAVIQQNKNKAAENDKTSKILSEQAAALSKLNSEAGRDQQQRLGWIKEWEAAQKLAFDKGEISAKQWAAVQDRAAREQVDVQIGYYRQLNNLAQRSGTA